MDCNCGNKNEGNFPPSVFQVNSVECPVLFHKVVIPTNFGDETETPVLMGEHRNALVYYEVNGHTYLYSSDGVPTRLDRGGASVLYVEELPETSKAMQDTLYVSSRGELAVYKSGDKKILNEKPTYYTTLGNNTDGAMTQKAVTDALSALSEEVKNKLAEFKNGVVDKVMPEVNEKVSGMERYVTTKIEEMKRETSTLVNTTTNDVNLMKNSLNKHIEQADITKNDLLDKIRRNTDSINDTKNSLRNYTLISDVDNRVSDAEARANNKITQAETRVNNTIGQAKTELDGKITEANGKISALDTKLTKQTSDNKADITQLKANLNTTNSALLTHKEQADKKFDDIKVEQSDQDTLISDILNAFSAESDKGTNLKLNTSATKVLGTSIYGNLAQNKYTGKNIINNLTFTTLYGSRTNTDTGVIIKRGNIDKPSIGVYSLSHNSGFRLWNFIISQTDVVLSFSIRSLTNQKINFVYRLEPLSYNNLQLTTSWQKVVYKVPKSNANNFAAFIFYASNLDMTDPNCGFEIKDVQIEAGTEATDYEPYIGSVLPNGFANLFDEFSNLPFSRDGVILSNQNGVLKLTGQPTADWIPLTSRNITSFLQDKQTYTVFQSNIYGVKLYPEVIAQRKDGGKSMSWNGQYNRTLTFTVDFDTYSSYSMKLQMGPKNSYPEPITFYNNYALFVGNYTADNLPEYSPFNTPLASPRPQLPQTIIGLSETNVQITNKNFFMAVQPNPIPNFKSVIEEDGSITFGGAISQWWGTNITTSHNILIPANNTYTLSIDKPLPYSMCLAIFGRNGRISVGEPVIGKNKTSITFTPSEDITRCHLYLSINGTDWSQNTPIPETNIKVQLEKGDTVTTYVKHESSELTIPNNLNIYKLTDDIYDEIRLENGVAKLIKRVGKLELSGEEEFKSIPAVNPGQYYIFSRLLDKLANTNVSNFVCSHFDIFNSTLDKGTLAQKSLMSLKLIQQNDIEALRIMFSAPDALNLKITDVASFKNWLKDEKAKGTPVTIYYEMKTSTEEEITDPALLAELKKLMEMRTYQDVTNISITGTDLTPDIKVKYMRKIGE